jgi:hypothetical protein
MIQCGKGCGRSASWWLMTQRWPVPRETPICDRCLARQDAAEALIEHGYLRPCGANAILESYRER